MMTKRETGELMSEAEMQEKMKEVINRLGQLILGCDNPVEIGHVWMFADLPLRVVRHATSAEYEFQVAAIEDLFGPSNVRTNYYVEVVVAD